MFHVKQAVSPLTAGDGRALFVEDIVEEAVGLDRHSSNYSGDGKAAHAQFRGTYNIRSIRKTSQSTGQR